MVRFLLRFTYKVARRIAVTVVGLSVVLFGVVLLFTPGPAFVVIPIGLAILSLEFAWARHWLHKIRETTAQAMGNRGEDYDHERGRYRVDYLNHEDHR